MCLFNYSAPPFGLHVAGSIPVELAKLGNLTQLHVRNNNLTGSLCRLAMGCCTPMVFVDLLSLFNSLYAVVVCVTPVYRSVTIPSCDSRQTIVIAVVFLRRDV